MREVNAVKQKAPRDTASSVDDLAAIWTLKTCKTIKEWKNFYLLTMNEKTRIGIYAYRGVIRVSSQS